MNNEKKYDYDFQYRHNQWGYNSPPCYLIPSIHVSQA